MRWYTVQINEYDLQAKRIRILSLIIHCTIQMKTNSRFSRNVKQCWNSFFLHIYTSLCQTSCFTWRFIAKIQVCLKINMFLYIIHLYFLKKTHKKRAGEFQFGGTGVQRERVWGVCGVWGRSNLWYGKSIATNINHVTAITLPCYQTVSKDLRL